MEQNQSELNLSGIVFDFSDEIGKPDPAAEELPDIPEPHNWLISILKAKSKCDRNLNLLIQSINRSHLQLLDNSIISNQIDATHQGLIQYMFHAWAKELGVVIKPDVFFYTIVSEIKNQIIDNPNKYDYLFTKSDNKECVLLVNLTVDKLMSALENKIPCKELFDVVTKSNFTTECDHFKQVMGITMADMGTPYYSYGTTKCGIPKVIVSGILDDWLNLTTSIKNLLHIFEYEGCALLTDYLNRVLVIMNELIDAAFTNKDKKFFSKMFIYYKNRRCGSGHEPIVLNGWIRKLYIGNYYNDEHYGYEYYVNNFPSHINCLPYDCRDDVNNIKYFFYLAGLTSSKIIDGFLYPEFNIVNCELTHPESKKIFDVLASNNNIKN